MPLFYNYDITTIASPINGKRLGELLTRTGYDPVETRFLVDGFEHGFDLGYRGPHQRQDSSPNIPFSVGNKFILWEKIMKEVSCKRFAGPYLKDNLPLHSMCNHHWDSFPKQEDRPG